MNKTLFSMFPEDLFKQFKRSDGLIGLIFYCFFIVWSYCFLLLSKNNSIPLPSNANLAKLILSAIFPISAIIEILFIVFFKNRQRLQ